MVQLSYVSSASQPMTAAGLLSILQQFCGHNPIHDITGLLYGNATFLQALDRETEEVPIDPPRRGSRVLAVFRHGSSRHAGIRRHQR